MICFPNSQVFLAALADAVVPRAISASPVRAGLATSRLWLQPDVPIPDDVSLGLKHLGAEFGPMPEVPLEPFSCWHQLLPLERGAAASRPAADGSVLFEVSVRDWPALAAELRRLTPNRHTVRWQENADGERVFLLVLEAPVYSLLRAQEPNATGSVFHAYVEQSPCVWVQCGWRHPLAEQIEPPPGNLLLIRPPRTWTLLADSFQDELSDYPLAPAPVRLEGAGAALRVSVPLRLVPRPPSENAELWVLRDRPLEQLAALTQNTDDALLARLNFAVGADRGRQVVLLRMTAARRATVLSIQGEAYHAHLKLPNLFVPCGHRLQPPLRRDAVRTLLAADPERITWLSPRADCSFRVESLPFAAFRPLCEAIEYVVPQGQALRAWQPAALFDLEAFTPAASRELTHAELRRALAPEPEETKKEPRPGLLRRILDWWRSPVVGPAAGPPRPAPEAPYQAKTLPVPDPISQAVQVFLQNVAPISPSPPPPADDEIPRHRLLERQFLEVSGPPDAHERLALWPELAGAYQEMEDFAAAGLCWLNALWEAHEGVPLWQLGWFRAAARGAHWQDTEEALDRILASPRLEAADVAAVAAYLTWASASEGTIPEARGARLRQLLETHEATLPIRAAWLAWTALARRSGDVLSLARARDRLLERLFRRGLSVEVDLHAFLRCTDQDGPHRAQAVRDWLVRVRGPIHDWIAGLHRNHRPPDNSSALVTERYLQQSPPFVPVLGVGELTRAYADLLLAWGLARLGIPAASYRLIDEARAALVTPDPVHTFLLAAFRYRIRQTLEGSAGGSLPGQLLDRLQKLDPVRERYKVDWLRRQSRILEPDEKIDPYRGDVLVHYFDDVHRQIAVLADVTDRAELAARLKAMLGEAGTSGSPLVLSAALAMAPRVGEEFALDLLTRVPPALDGLEREEQQAPLLERALFLAAHFDQAEFVQSFVGRFQHLLDVRRGDGARAVAAFESLAAQSFRGLRKLGMREEVDRLQREMADALLQGQSIRSLRGRPGGNQAAVWRTLLQVAAGWFYAGNEEQATAVLDEVRALLFANMLDPREQTALARAYAGALGSAPLGTALERIEEMFARLRGVQDRLTTGSHFSLAQLDVIEAVVLAVANDDFALGTAVRRWLDEDEFLVRRRIHQDLRALLSPAGM